MARKRPSVYPNLSAEMERDGVSRDDIAKVVGRTTECVGGWLAGASGEFPISGALAVQAMWWPNIPVDELFKRVDQPKVAEVAA